MGYQIDPGKLTIPFRGVDLDDVVIFRWGTNRKLAVNYAPSEWTCFIVSDADCKAPVKWNGVPFGADCLAIVQPGIDHEFMVPAGWFDIQIDIKTEVLEREIGLIRENCLSSSEPYPQIVQLAPNGAARLRRLLGIVLAHPESGVAVPKLSQLWFNIKLAIFDELCDQVSAQLAPSNPKRRANGARHSALIQQTREHICRADLSDYSVASVCNELETDRQTLLRAFRNILGTTPSSYLMSYRLHSARKKIQKGDSTSILQIATDLGFCSGSEFAMHYRKLFGELPSATNRNAS